MIESYYINPIREIKAMIPKEYYIDHFIKGYNKFEYNGEFDAWFSYDIADYFSLHFLPVDFEILLDLLPNNTKYRFFYSEGEDEEFVEDDEECEEINENNKPFDDFLYDPLYKIKYSEITKAIEEKLSNE